MTARLDGRKSDELREITITFDGLARVDGSARFAFGQTVALASISGPLEVRPLSEHPSHATFEVILRPLSHVPSTESKSLAATIRSLLTPSLLLTQNPRTLIQLVIQSLSQEPNWKWTAVAAMINASVLAILNSGSVPMRGVVCAVSVGSVSSSSALVADPSEDEAKSLQAGGCFAFMFAAETGTLSSECVWSNWQTKIGASFDEKEIVRAREVAREAAKQVWETMHESIERMGERDPLRASELRKARIVEDEILLDSKQEKDSDDDDKMEI